jgi:hypothetical protein
VRPLPLVLSSLLLAAPALAGKPEPVVVVSTGRLVVLGDRQELREHLEKADRLLADALRKDTLRKSAKKALIEECLNNARNRLDNAREFLGFEREDEQAKAIQKEGREDDERLADAVVSQRLVVADLDTLWWELGRADFNLSRAGSEAEKQDLRDVIEQARGEASLARSALAKSVDLGRPTAPPAAPPAPEASPFRPVFPAPAFPPAPQAMSEPAFQALLAVLDREAFADDRLRVLETAASSQRFAGDQVLELLTRFPFSHHKLRAVRLLKDRLVEKGGEFQLYGAFTFESDKAALKRLLDGGELEAPRPIENDALDQLVSALKKGFASQVGHQILREEAGRRWFLVDQASRVLGVFPTFDARLRALQIVRPRVLDPENWQRLEPLFATMDDRAQLRALFGPGR